MDESQETAKRTEAASKRLRSVSSHVGDTLGKAELWQQKTERQFPRAGTGLDCKGASGSLLGVGRSYFLTGSVVTLRLHLSKLKELHT